MSDDETETFYHFMENISSFRLWWQQHISKKVETGRCLPLCTIPFLLTTVCKCLGSAETPCWSFRTGMFTRPWCRILAARQSWAFVARFFLFCTSCGQICERILFLWRRAVVMDAGCGLALSCWNMQGLTWGICLDGSICCSKTSSYCKIKDHSTKQHISWEL